MTEIIKVYGDQAKNINDGDEYIAVVSSIEGRKVVSLWAKDWCPECEGRNYKHYSGCKKVE